MKPWKDWMMIFLLYGCLVALALLTSCQGPETPASLAAENRLVQEIHDANLDGIITSEEQARIDHRMEEYITARQAEPPRSGVDWTTFWTSVAASVIPGGGLIAASINAYRNATRAKALASLQPAPLASTTAPPP
jgi:hypothetical protein